MCGIVGIVSTQPVAHRLIDGLQRLEYRGYDSTGIATVEKGTLYRHRAEGKLINLREIVAQHPLPGTVGIGHTRWATHGIPSELNAHPHMTDRVAVIHNGIIENYLPLKQRLQDKGHTFLSQTDTEIVAHLITDHLKAGASPQEAFKKSLKELKGAFALAVLFADHPHFMAVGRQGSPLAIGYGNGEISIGSDALTLSLWTQDISYLEEGDYAYISPIEVEIYNLAVETPVTRPIKKTMINHEVLTKGPYKHYMLKEIFEQPVALADTLHAYIDQENQTPVPSPVAELWTSFDRVYIIACGSSYLAAMTAKYWFERIACLPVEVDIASEFRYRYPVLLPNSLIIFISQSGETLDTLAALQLVKGKGHTCLAILNVPESSIARLADHAIYTHAGPEIGVASTKGLATQLLVLGLLVFEAAHRREQINDATLKQAIYEFMSLPSQARQVLELDQELQVMAGPVSQAQDVFFIGRGEMYPLALEGALKLKEISYIHAEGFPAGELKHGPIALIEAGVPVVILCPPNELFEKTLANAQEIMAREGRVYVFTEDPQKDVLQNLCTRKGQVLSLPPINNIIVRAILYIIPLQLLAYYVALMKGTDIDQPRNLAKSVTVE